MQCPLCNVDMFISRTGKHAQGDKSPDTQTVIYETMYFTCRNPQCARLGQEIEGEPYIIFGNLPQTE